MNAAASMRLKSDQLGLLEVFAISYPAAKHFCTHEFFEEDV